MKITNASPLGDLDVPLLGVMVKHGETIDVLKEAAERLLEQDIWKPGDRAAETAQVALDARRTAPPTAATLADDVPTVASDEPEPPPSVDNVDGDDPNEE